jgi:hypothetical protein
MRAGAKISIFLAVFAVLVVLPAAALGDPGHAADQPHLSAERESSKDSGTLLIAATLVTLLVFAVCAFLLKQSQAKRE